MMIDNFLLVKLSCTKCGGDLEEVGEFLQCKSCNTKFMVKDNIPIFFNEE